MYKIFDKAMKNWKVELTTEKKDVRILVVKIQRGIFQGDNQQKKRTLRILDDQKQRR